MKPTVVAWDRIDDIGLVRQIEAVAARRGLAFGWIDATGGSLLPHHQHDDGCDGRGCAGSVRTALRDNVDPWMVVSPHPLMREIAAPVTIGSAVVGALLVGGYAEGALSDGEIGLLGELLAEAAREVAGAATITVIDRATPMVPRTELGGIIGSAPSMQALYETLTRVARSDSTVLIQGENGTGKELVARAIHQGSPRIDRPFVVTNCSAFNDNLLDSELFGHKRGAFTGAVSDKPGLFEIADTGTFFLDEIGDMSPTLQVKVLRVLQEGTFNRVGDTDTRKVDVRIIAATNRDLAAMVAAGLFREDLYYRIHVINLTLPPLRDRVEDIPVLASYFLGRQRHGSTDKELTAACLGRMLTYPWPGNVRELENEIERLVVLSGDDGRIEEDLLSSRIRHHHVEPVVELTLDPGSLPAAVESLERRMIVEALRRHRGNKTRASADLKVSRRNLIRLVQKYGLDDARTPSRPAASALGSPGGAVARAPRGGWGRWAVGSCAFCHFSLRSGCIALSCLSSRRPAFARQRRGVRGVPTSVRTTLAGITLHADPAGRAVVGRLYWARPCACPTSSRSR
ncbi:MAG: sigma 54-interacting transcriptional regulator [Myxococcales bacterium]|nr:sigma 54-interacting transcriptional regulator [Myxococcales bacterium]